MPPTAKTYRLCCYFLSGAFYLSCMLGEEREGEVGGRKGEKVRKSMRIEGQPARRPVGSLHVCHSSTLGCSPFKSDTHSWSPCSACPLAFLLLYPHSFIPDRGCCSPSLSQSLVSHTFLGQEPCSGLLCPHPMPSWKATTRMGQATPLACASEPFGRCLQPSLTCVLFHLWKTLPYLP